VLPRVRRRAGLAVVACLGLTGCAGSIPPPDANQVPPPAQVETVADADPSPAQLALAHVPADADVAVLTVTDYERVELQLGVDEITSKAPAGERRAFWRRAEADTALLSPGMLRPADQRLRRDFSFGQEDVSWEAHLFDSSGEEIGWILGLDLLLDPRVVRRAAQEGVAVLEGAEVDVERSLAVGGVAELDAGGDSWAQAPVADLVSDDPAIATYVEQGCVEATEGLGSLDPLERYVVDFAGGLATARLGAARQDLFTRMRLAADDAGFGDAFDGGVADPRTGRIGYRLVDPAAAADLVERRRAPFAACTA